MKGVYELRFAFMCKEPPSVVPGRGKLKVAIVGGGPAGLSAAGFLVCQGYDVYVFDKQPIAGGLMLFAIPEERIPPESVLEGIEELRDKFNVNFMVKTKVFGDTKPREDEGDNLVERVVSLKELVDNYDAILLTTGTWCSRKLNCPGEEGPGVMSALEFLYELRIYEKGYTSHKPHLGNRVVVIGGGLSAVDAALEALRLGAKEVVMAYRRTIKQAPAGVYEIKKLINRGVKWIELVSPIKIVRENGEVKGIELQKMKLGEPDESGRPRPIPIPGSEFVLEADTIIEAIGEIPTPPFEDEYLGLKADRRGRIQVNEHFRTTHPKIWAAGDVVTGPSMVGSAVRQGLYAAKSIHIYLTSKKLI